MLKSIYIISKWVLSFLRRPWFVMEDDGLCGLTNGSVVNLTFSMCYPDKYTCNTGECIPLA